MIRLILSISALLCRLWLPAGRQQRTALCLAAAGLLLAPFFPGSVLAAETAAQEVVIKVERLNLRSGPSQSAKVLAVLDKGTRLPLVRRMDSWVEVSYKGEAGYLRHRERYLSIVADAKKKAAEIEKIRQKAASIQQRIEASQAQVVTYTQQEADMVDSLDAMDRKLHQARVQVAAASRELERTEEQIVQADQEITATEKKMRALEGYAAQRLVALYKLNWLGRINILASAESMSELFHRERALGRILAHDEKVLGELDRHRIQLAALRDQQAARRQTHTELAAELKSQIENLARDRKRHDRMLSEIRGKKSLELAALDNLRRSADQLDQKIRDLGESIIRETVPQPEPSQPPKPAPAKEKADVADTEAAQVFSDLKGLLNMPVNGKVISFFGPYRNRKFNVMNFRSGVDIRADLGEPVMAVCEGKVLYSSWFKGYGNMLIVDHGGNYYTVYAHVEEMFKTKGARVEAGEVIATVGDTGSMAGPKLHFEIRYHGKPLDPMEWIKKG